jgi:transposase InsO family protein
MPMMAETLGIQPQSLERWMNRNKTIPSKSRQRGRPEVIPQSVRWKLRACYLAHYGQWGPSVLRYWAIREGLGRFSAGTISRVIDDLKPPPSQDRPKPKKYEIAAPMVMWSEDGAALRDGNRKRELLVAQDECSRFKTNWHLAKTSAKAAEVEAYLRQAFEQYGAPLVLKHDGGSIFHDTAINRLLDEYQVVELTSPRAYPPFNGKKERSMRDIKSYERALRKNGFVSSLPERIEISMQDLNEDRPRPVLNGMTAREVLEQNHITLPDRRRFKMEVDTLQMELEAKAGSRKEVESARRRAVINVLSRYNLINWKGNVSTNFINKSLTN